MLDFASVLSAELYLRFTPMNDSPNSNDSDEVDSDDSEETPPGGLIAFGRSLLPYAMRYRGLGALVLGGVLLEMGFMSSVPICFKFLVDDVVDGGKADWLPILLPYLGIAVIVISATGLACDYLYSKLVSKMMGDIRARLFTHLQNLGMEFFTRAKPGDTLNRFSGDLVTVESTLSGAVGWIVLPSLDLLASTCILFTLDWRLATLASLVFPLTLLGPRWLLPRADAAAYDRKVEEGRLLSFVQEDIAAQPVVKAFNLLGRMLGQFAERNAILIGKCLRLNFLEMMVERSASMAIRLLQVAVLGLGVYLAWKQQLSIGSLAAFQSLYISLCTSLQFVYEFSPNLIGAAGAMRHVDDMFKEPERVKDASDARELSRLQKEIAFNDVHFSYTGERNDLEGVSLRIPCGNNVAFVGPSGSGKSTMINMVMRFYDPSKGSVAIDGQDLANVTQASLHHQTGIVFQESFLFNASIRENIRMGNSNATDAEVEAAAKKAEIHDVILKLPNGYDTPVGERGGRLSGGQRQRIAVARALVRDPAILVLDEATSALDPATEEAINRTLAGLSKGRTVLSVTHRLRSVQNCDRIFVMEQGHLVEQGSHAELLQARGIYQQLWQKQAGFTVSEDGSCALIAPDKLLELPFLADLPKDLREKAAGMFHTEEWGANHAICHQGDIGNRLYVIVRGRAGVFYRKKGADEVRVAVLEEGDFFGEIALLCNVPRTATVRTLTPCIVLALHRAALFSLLEDAPDLRAKLQHAAEERLPMYRKEAERACQDVDVEWDVA
jgi:ATP-binding cassette subfamily B protein